ncbi:YvcK family protein [Streptomonospora sp. PA3]|uniref:gluconeogenesis factor YvcK family protein n=1 Tax=Streptomonospora sp. PA3 TaxID=2607326 RepID=UPI0012DBEB76|nr:gluconeogenesis factor YvcK family protein [Streptomonospora sp. PA3]MUL41441.1 YvcK family protein [Streptomonospora sp. PA3]
MTSGPSVVAIGGGRGLSVTLQAARSYAGRVTAVVATADDSGSTGRLRTAMDLPAPGDVRRCLTALAGVAPDLLGQAFEYRFPGTDLEGHALGNLIVAGLAATSGDFVAAVDETARLLGMDPAFRRVLPATAEQVGLRATTADGREIVGQYAISKTAGIRRVRLDPEGVKAPDGLAAAISAADQVVLGPGSIYTSVLAAVLVEDLLHALRSTPAQTVYVCNLGAESRESEGYDVAAHIDALHAHGVEPDVTLLSEGARLPLGDAATEVVMTDLGGGDGETHDSAKLGAALAALAGTPRPADQR